MSASAASSRCAAIFLPFAIDLVQRLHDRGAAHRQRARTVRAHAERDATGVAVHDFDIGDVDPEPARDDLRKRRLVALAMAVRAGEHRHASRRIDAHLARLEQARARAQRARDVRRRQPARLDVRCVPQPAQHAALGRGGLARRETRDVRDLHRVVERRVVVADIVGQRDRRRVRELADEIASPNLVLRDSRVHGGLVDDALDHVRRLGPARAAIGVDRRRIGERRRHLAEDRRRRVLAGEQRRIENRRNAARERRQVRAHVGGGLHAKGQELAVLVQRQLDVRHVVAAVRIGEECLAAIGRPLDRAIHFLRRPHQCGFLGVQVDLGAEAASDVRRDHAHLRLGQPEHERRHQQPLDVRILVGHVQRVRLVGAAVRRHRRARLDRIRNEAVVDDVELGHRRRLGEGRVDRRLVAQRPRVALVARRLLVDLRRAGLQRLDAVDDGRQRLRSRRRSVPPRLLPDATSPQRPARPGRRRGAPCPAPGPDAAARSSACRRCR